MKKEYQALLESYPYFKECSIQTFDDDSTRKDLSLAKIFSQNDLDLEKLEQLNKK
jgi:hypothetical protein